LATIQLRQLLSCGNLGSPIPGGEQGLETLEFHSRRGVERSSNPETISPWRYLLRRDRPPKARPVDNIPTSRLKTPLFAVRIRATFGADQCWSLGFLTILKRAAWIWQSVSQRSCQRGEFMSLIQSGCHQLERLIDPVKCFPEIPNNSGKWQGGVLDRRAAV